MLETMTIPIPIIVFVLGILFSTIGWLLGGVVKSIRSETEAVKDTTCKMHHESFRRVHEEREIAEKIARENAKELTANISLLSNGVTKLNGSIDLLSERVSSIKECNDEMKGEIRLLWEKKVDKEAA